jgi:peptide/nickel transport system substrate-binding protein
LLGGATALLVAGLSLAACTSNSGSSGTASPAATGSSSSSSTLKVTASEEMDDLNPFLGTEQGKSEVLSAIAPPMLYYNGNNQITSQLLSSWSATDNDMSIKLVLKPGMKWSDGQPITSADMLMSLTAYLDAPISSNAGRVGAVAGEDALARSPACPPPTRTPSTSSCRRRTWPGSRSWRWRATFPCCPSTSSARTP